MSFEKGTTGGNGPLTMAFGPYKIAFYMSESCISEDEAFEALVSDIKRRGGIQSTEADVASAPKDKVHVRIFFVRELESFGPDEDEIVRQALKFGLINGVINRSETSAGISLSCRYLKIVDTSEEYELGKPHGR